MLGPVLQFEDLQQLTGYQRLSDVERCLTEQKIPFKRCRGGVWTTVAALNAALGVSSPGNDEAYTPGQVF